MSKYVINDTTLTAIGDAVREKGGTSALIPVSGLAEAIINLPSGGGGDIEVEPIVLSGVQSYGCSGDIGSTYIRLFGNTISTQDIIGSENMFTDYTLERVPFEINYKNNYNGNSLIYMFYRCTNLREPPKLNNCQPGNLNAMFNGCERIQIPDDYFNNWDWSLIAKDTSAYGKGNKQQLFYSCKNLRKIPENIISQDTFNINLSLGYSYGSMFFNCITLDEVVDLGVAYNSNTTYNSMGSLLNSCYRLKRFTFAKQADGSPYVCSKWKAQTIDLSDYTGYCTSNYEGNIQIYSDIPTSKRVSNDEEYQALKNDPDWYAVDVAYSRYNHDSAVETINSLPDCSASSGNTIKFKGAAGSATDGGAINTLTEEEIAVATAKGWTVTLV